jgi:D-alanine-D-alanine ligase
LSAEFLEDREIVVRPGNGLWLTKQNTALPVDICFPVTHGTGGEDGLLQGLLELAHLPYVGCDPAASSIGMHKYTAKLFARDHGVPTLPSIRISADLIGSCTSLGDEQFTSLYTRITTELGTSIILKPEDGGSSVGVQVVDPLEPIILLDALRSSSRYTKTVLAESLVKHPMELECALVEHKGTLAASLPGLVVDPVETGSRFLTYEQKYLGSNCAYMQLPAPIAPELAQRIKDMALVVGRAIGVEGYARVDFLYSPETGRIWFNEINTLPGMTAQSHFPILAASIGFDWPALVDALLTAGFERQHQKATLTFTAVE